MCEGDIREEEEGTQEGGVASEDVTILYTYKMPKNKLYYKVIYAVFEKLWWETGCEWKIQKPYFKITYDPKAISVILQGQIMSGILQCYLSDFSGK